jgi:hypothetical protein
MTGRPYCVKMHGFACPIPCLRIKHGFCTARRSSPLLVPPFLRQTFRPLEEICQLHPSPFVPSHTNRLLHVFQTENMFCNQMRKGVVKLLTALYSTMHILFRTPCMPINTTIFRNCFSLWLGGASGTAKFASAAGFRS